jgi:hypothetical protein
MHTYDRPLADPTLAEKEEGLFQYNPFIHILPQQALTQDSRIAGEALHVLTASGMYIYVYVYIYMCV